MIKEYDLENININNYFINNDLLTFQLEVILPIGD